MEFKTTKRNVMDNNSTIIYTGYCEMQCLLSCFNKTCYTSGVYGWNADVYCIDGMCFCTGYRPFGTVRADYNTVKTYEDKAKEVSKYYSMSFDDRKEKCLALLHDLWNEVTTK